MQEISNIEIIGFIIDNKISTQGKSCEDVIRIFNEKAGTNRKNPPWRIN